MMGGREPFLTRRDDKARTLTKSKKQQLERKEDIRSTQMELKIRIQKIATGPRGQKPWKRHPPPRRRGRCRKGRRQGGSANSVRGTQAESEERPIGEKKKQIGISNLSLT